MAVKHIGYPSIDSLLWHHSPPLHVYTAICCVHRNSPVPRNSRHAHFPTPTVARGHGTPESALSKQGCWRKRPAASLFQPAQNEHVLTITVKARRTASTGPWPVRGPGKVQGQRGGAPGYIQAESARFVARANRTFATRWSMEDRVRKGMAA